MLKNHFVEKGSWERGKYEGEGIEFRDVETKKDVKEDFVGEEINESSSRIRIFWRHCTKLKGQVVSS